ncbi:hypothetical protein [Pseudomonas sp. zfem002]|uniref:hypothetical protein n=1 Tax=Pseudomonas sp. zfem002 TaxID=3078197 RepID=UPI002929839D|nr:hypothetical protein [Pseudomonas sp. zfem002]MDU9389661.1 hypothetical protein [Pseudomonas sp. zfem002]
MASTSKKLIEMCGIGDLSAFNLASERKRPRQLRGLFDWRKGAVRVVPEQPGIPVGASLLANGGAAVVNLSPGACRYNEDSGFVAAFAPIREQGQALSR